MENLIFLCHLGLCEQDKAAFSDHNCGIGRREKRTFFSNPGVIKDTVVKEGKGLLVGRQRRGALG